MDLERNECIDKSFECPGEFQDLLERVAENCMLIETPTFGNGKSQFELNSVCANSITDRIYGGTRISPGEFPFLVALYDYSTESFFCGGALITAKHVLTAAHCVHQKQEQKINPEEVFVLLGRYNISLKAEKGSKARFVQEIFIHPDWDSNSMKYNADIAILELDEEVQFSSLIMPICVDDNPDNQLSHDGKVASRIISEKVSFR